MVNVMVMPMMSAGMVWLGVLLCLVAFVVLSWEYRNQRSLVLLVVLVVGLWLAAEATAQAIYFEFPCYPWFCWP